MSSFTSKDVSHIVKFNGKNFPFWKFQVWLVLEQHDLVELVLGEEEIPEEIYYDDADITNATEISTWKKKDNTARCYLVSTIEQQCQRTLVNCKTAHEMWTRLSSQHQQNASENKHLLQQKFFEFKYAEGEDIVSHITSIETMA